MNIRLGLIGADDSVERIRAVATDYPQIELRSLVYWQEDEVPELIRRHSAEVDMWLFSGQVPYAVARQRLGFTVPAFWVPHTGASLLGLLLFLSHEKGIKVSEVSFDTVDPVELGNALADIGLAAPRYLHHYSDAIEASRLADYHAELWRQGQTKVAVTCLRSAHVELVRRGIPAYHVVPARAAIAATLETVVRTHELLHYRGAQVAVVLARGPAAGTERSRWLDWLRRCARLLSGTVQELQDGEAAIWTTRRFLETVSDGFRNQPVLPPPPATAPIPRCFGIGLGQSVSQAQGHARYALQCAEQNGPDSWYAVFDDTSVIGPLGKADQLQFSYGDRRLREASRRAGVSGTTLSKVLAALRVLGRDELSSQQLADQLNILPRSARRLLTVLEAAGFAEVVGEEAPNLRGRPRKIYRIRLPVFE